MLKQPAHRQCRRLARTGLVVILENAAKALLRGHASPVPAPHVRVELQHRRRLVEPAEKLQHIAGEAATAADQLARPAKGCEHGPTTNELRRVGTSCRAAVSMEVQQQQQERCLNSVIAQLLVSCRGTAWQSPLQCHAPV